MVKYGQVSREIIYSEVKTKNSQIQVSHSPQDRLILTERICCHIVLTAVSFRLFRREANLFWLNVLTTLRESSSCSAFDMRSTHCGSTVLLLLDVRHLKKRRLG
jgi:hypothetical protein